MLPPWVIVQTKPMAEELTERQFRMAGYRVYLPHYRKLLLPHGATRRPDSVMRPLFERLVFVQDWQRWPKISISGATGLMQSRPGTAAKLSDADIAIIMDRERAGEFDMLKPRGDGVLHRHDLEVGDQVEFEATFGAKITGVLAELSSNGKAVIAALVFDRMVKINVKVEALHKVVV
jgi:hypothetical protein